MHDKSHPNSTSCSSVSINKTELNSNRLPLRLLHLPRSTPLAGTAGLVDAFVSLEARVLARGFMVGCKNSFFLRKIILYVIDCFRRDWWNGCMAKVLVSATS